MLVQMGEGGLPAQPTKKCHSSIEPEWCALESEIGLLSEEQLRPILRDQFCGGGVVVVVVVVSFFTSGAGVLVVVVVSVCLIGPAAGVVVVVVVLCVAGGAWVVVEVVDSVVLCAIIGNDRANTISDPRTTASRFLDFIRFSLKFFGQAQW